MALNIRNKDADRLATQLARLTGDTKAGAVIKALREQLNRVRKRGSGRRLADDLTEIAQRCARLPVLDRRSAEEILDFASDRQKNR